ncbi:MAG: gas vesicle protein GvpG [Dehalococcoidales bacterium]|nr:gas vesicle protein GvpG [Dehalococcoidales bacterium]
MPRYLKISKMPNVSMFRYFGAKWPRGVAPRPPNCLPENKDSLVELFTWPMSLARTSIQTIRETAERELYLSKEAMLRGELLEVEIRFERGEISEEEYQQRVAKIKRRLEELGAKIEES